MRLALALTLALLAGCASRPPKVETITVTVERIVPVPADLTRDCADEAPRDQTNGEAKRLANVRKLALDECTGRMREIRKLGDPQ